MKRMIIVFLMVCGVVFGAYDNSVRDVTVGGYGYSTSTGNPTLANNTLSMPEHRFGSDGTITGFDVKMYTPNGSGTPAVTVKLKVLSGASSPFTLEQTEDITAQVNAAMPAGADRFNVNITGLGIPVAAGEFVAVFVDANVQCVRNTTDIGLINLTGNGDTETLPSSSTGSNWLWECTVSTNETIILSNTTGYSNGDVIPIPAYNDQGQYFVIEDVDVPTGEDLDIILSYTHATTAADTVEKTLSIDFVLDPDAIAMGAATNVITGQDGEKFNIHIWTDPVNDKIEVFYVNTEAGQGPTGDAVDIRHISLQGRAPAALTADISIKRITLSQNTGIAATVGNIVVCRKPLVVVGDSMLSDTYIGSELDTAFSENRYIIQGAIGGNALLRSSDVRTATITRWNAGRNEDSSDDDTQLDQDLVAFRDVVVIAGACIFNDFFPLIDATSSEDLILATSQRLGAALATIAGDSRSEYMYKVPATPPDSVVNDIVIVEQIPYIANSGQELINESDTIEGFNAKLLQTSFELGIPVAQVHDGYAASGSGYADTIHPDATGITFVANAITEAYEQNKIATASDVGLGGPSGYRSRYR